MTHPIRIVALVLTLVACGGGIQVDECDDESTSTLDCQMCCEEQGFSGDRVNYNSAVRYGCTCFEG